MTQTERTALITYAYDYISTIGERAYLKYKAGEDINVYVERIHLVYQLIRTLERWANITVDHGVRAIEAKLMIVCKLYGLPRVALFPPISPIVYNTRYVDTLDGNIIYSLGELTEAASIVIDCESYQQVDAFIVDMARTATTLNFSNFGRVFNLSMTKDNSDQDLVFTLAGSGLVFHVYDSDNNIYSLDTTITLSGTDSDNSFELSFKRTGITGDIIQVTGTIA